MGLIPSQSKIFIFTRSKILISLFFFLILFFFYLLELLLAVFMRDQSFPLQKQSVPELAAFGAELSRAEVTWEEMTGSRFFSLCARSGAAPLR